MMVAVARLALVAHAEALQAEVESNRHQGQGPAEAAQEVVTPAVPAAQGVAAASVRADR